MAGKLKKIGVNEHIADDNLNSLFRAKEMNLPFEVMDSLVYHDGKPLKDLGNKYSSANLGTQFDDLISDRERKPTISAQLSAIADDIANDSRDVRDIFKSTGALGAGKTISELRQSSTLFNRVYGKVKEINPSVEDERLIGRVISGIRREYIADIKEEYQRRVEQGSESGVMIAFSSKMQKEHDELRQSMRSVFKQSPFNNIDKFVDNCLGTIFDYFYKNAESVGQEVASMEDGRVKDESMRLVSKISDIEKKGDGVEEKKARAIVKFVYTKLDDRSAYDLAKSIDSIEHSKRLNSAISR